MLQGTALGEPDSSFRRPGGRIGLGDLPDSLVLYGGTALALRLGHRSSVDFDFFSSEQLDVDALFELPCLAGAEVLQREPDTWPFP